MNEHGAGDDAAGGEAAAARRAAIIRAAREQMNPSNVRQIRNVYRPAALQAIEQELSLRQFTDPDDAPEIDTYVQALEAFDRLPQLQELKHLAIERTGTGPGRRVLDVGCGFGLESLRLARLVQPDGSVTGIDISDNFIGDARRRAAAAGLTIDFAEGDAQRLTFPDDSFDITRAERVLIYLDDPDAALAEIIRVTRPGGSIAIIEPDFDTNTINVDNREITRKVLAHECDAGVVNGWLVRDLRAKLTDAGLTDVELGTRMVVYDPDLAAEYFTNVGRTAGMSRVIDGGELAYWEDTIADLHRQGRLFAAIGYYLFTARLPG
jgi:SAM-dependent methyltransferase